MRWGRLDFLSWNDRVLSIGLPPSSKSRCPFDAMGVLIGLQSIILNLLRRSWVYFSWDMKTPSFICLTWNHRKKDSSPTMDISNSLDIKSPNSLQKSLLVEPKIIIISINLANEDFPIHFLGEECCVNFPNLEALLNEEVPKPLIPSSRSFLETIESLG